MLVLIHTAIITVLALNISCFSTVSRKHIVSKQLSEKNFQPGLLHLSSLIFSTTKLFLRNIFVVI